MINSGFIERLGEENVCPHIAASLARARQILHLPPEPESPNDGGEAMHAEKQQIEAARRELSEAIARAGHLLGESKPPAPTPPR
jgi:SulP family sulfate permease